VFGKKQSERMPTWKLWDYTIDLKKGFMPRKRKVYLLSREEWHQCSLWERRIGRKEWYKITDISMSEQ